MIGKGLGLKVLIGIVLGSLLGYVLVKTMPVGVQPNDTLKLTTAYGETISVAIPADKKKPAQVKIGGEETGEPVLVAGMSIDDAAQAIGDATGIEVASAELEQRAAVTIRPAITEIVYVGGEIFLRLLKMLVVPLVIATVLVGIASLGNARKLGKLGGMTAFIYISTMLIAATIGSVYVNLMQPGLPL